MAANDPIIVHGVHARAALTAYCTKDDPSVDAALAQIPFRSTYRDWVQILKALQQYKHNRKTASALLERIAPQSGFYALKQAAEMAFLSEFALLAELPKMSQAQQQFVTALHGWSSERFQLWQRLQKVSVATFIKQIQQYPHLIQSDWSRRYALRLLVASSPNEFEKIAALGTPITPFERALVAAWHEESLLKKDLDQAFAYWQKVIRQLNQPGKPRPKTERALQIALIQRRLQQRFNLLNSDDQEQMEFALEESLHLDPDDMATYQLLISHYRQQNRLPEARRWLEQAQQLWPQAMSILNEALQTAIASNAFKKAAKIAQQMLAIDPINRQAKESLYSAHLAHARKQIKKTRLDLAAKEFAAAADWALDTQAKTRILMLDALSKLTPRHCISLKKGLEIKLADGQSLQQILLDAVIQFGDGLSGQFILAYEAFQLDIVPAKLLNKIKLQAKKPKDKSDLLAFAQQLRQHIKLNPQMITRLLPYFRKALAAGARLRLSKSEAEQMCETLSQCKLHPLRQQYAKAALARWPNEPIFVFHKIDALHAVNPLAVTDHQIDQLEDAFTQAKEQGDQRAVHQISNLLHEFVNPFFDLSDPSPRPNHDLDPEELTEILAFLLEQHGIDPEDLSETMFLTLVTKLFSASLSGEDPQKALAPTIAKIKRDLRR